MASKGLGAYNPRVVRRKVRGNLVFKRYLGLVAEGKVHLHYRIIQCDEVHAIRFRLKRVSSKRKQQTFLVVHTSERPGIKIHFRRGRLPYYLSPNMLNELYKMTVTYGKQEYEGTLIPW